MKKAKAREEERPLDIEEGDDFGVTTFKLPKRLLKALKEDGVRCRRSMGAQLEAILAVIYFHENVELHNVDRYTPSVDSISKRKAG